MKNFLLLGLASVLTMNTGWSQETPPPPPTVYPDNPTFSLRVKNEDVRTSSLYYYNFEDNYVDLELDKNKILLEYSHEGSVVQKKKLKTLEKIKERTDYKYYIEDGEAKLLISIKEKEGFNLYAVRIDLESQIITSQKSVKRFKLDPEKWDIDLTTESGKTRNYVARCYARSFKEKDLITVMDKEFDILYESEIDVADKVDYIDEMLENAKDESTLDENRSIYKDILKAHKNGDDFPYNLRSVYMNIQLSESGRYLIYGVRTYTYLPDYSSSNTYSLNDMNTLYVYDMKKEKEFKIQLFEHESSKKLLKRFYKIIDDAIIVAAINENPTTKELSQEISVYNFKMEVAIASHKALDFKRLQTDDEDSRFYTDIDIIDVAKTGEFNYNTILSIEEGEYLEDDDDEDRLVAIQTTSKKILQIHSNVENDDIKTISTAVHHHEDELSFKLYFLHVLANKIMDQSTDEYIILAIPKLDIKEIQTGSTLVMESELEGYEFTCINTTTGEVVKKSLKVDDDNYFSFDEELMEVEDEKNMVELIRFHGGKDESERITVQVKPAK
ncbi:hypothetical protein SAMN05216474_0172 [Lishizhenia tianjinensis]|uniref:Uncharacterized protein n=1 Tax=Lishizhenia tianjinensis TaxID=477690 RepID=A0A1I6XGN4_9FLAO|nr:hypothetical protein [Lishizhenia tianjinensis]SFT37211.1 hypothetical protein SAMN05216474_0172 [Lishizhenia tianjinensis]